jgi:hypothetical protein
MENLKVHSPDLLNSDVSSSQVSVKSKNSQKKQHWTDVESVDEDKF